MNYRLNLKLVNKDKYEAYLRSQLRKASQIPMADAKNRKRERSEYQYKEERSLSNTTQLNTLSVFFPFPLYLCILYAYKMVKTKSYEIWE